MKFELSRFGLFTLAVFTTHLMLQRLYMAVVKI
jgi:hypothetical protein